MLNIKQNLVKQVHAPLAEGVFVTYLRRSRRWQIAMTFKANGVLQAFTKIYFEKPNKALILQAVKDLHNRVEQYLQGN